MIKQYRVFVAHSKADSDAEVQLCISLFASKYDGKGEFKFTLGREDYEKNFKTCGGWAAWTRNVVHGVPYGSNEKNYNLILVPSFRVGKATADIIEEALACRTQVVVRDGDTFKKVVGVGRVSEEWKDGWQVEAR